MLVVALAILGFFSPFFIHELSHLITIKIFQKTGKDIFLVEDKPLWKQPAGLILLSGHLGDLVYLSLLICLAFIFHAPLPVITALAGTMISLFSICSGSSADICRYKKHSALIRTGCACGYKKFVTGAAKTKCLKCGKILCEWFTGLRLTPAHLSPTYLFSRKVTSYKYSVSINADIEQVFNYLLAGFSRAFIQEFKIKDYQKVENQVIYKVDGIPIRRIIVEEKRPILIRYRIEFGTEQIDEIFTVARKNKYTVLSVEGHLSFLEAENVLKKPIKKTLNFMKKEIEA